MREIRRIGAPRWDGGRYLADLYVRLTHLESKLSNCERHAAAGDSAFMCLPPEVY
jgi:hypothetical protein